LRKILSIDGVVDDQRTVGLLGGQPHHLCLARPLQDVDRVGHRLEHDLAFGPVDPRTRRQGRQHLASEFRQDEGVGEQPDAPSAPHPGQCQLRRKRRCLLVFPADRQRQQPATLLIAGLDLDFAQEQFPPRSGPAPRR
jgi:hypothetical protein